MSEAAIARPSMQACRDTIFVEDAKLLFNRQYPGEQFVQRYLSPLCAEKAIAGSFVHVACDPLIPMRRPLSIMRANAGEGWIDLLFKVEGIGLRELGRKNPGDEVSFIGPIGHGFHTSVSRPNRLLIGGGVGIPPMIFLAEQIIAEAGTEKPTVLMGSEIPFPFDVMRATHTAGWLPDDPGGSMPLLEEWGVACRLASLAKLADTYTGYVTDLAKLYIASLTSERRLETELFACGPTPMLKAVAKLAAEFELPCQVSLEEYMACAVGGCAGCTVRIQNEAGPAMKRVCVDGPVFEASTVLF